jgi:hypothetical protein
MDFPITEFQPACLNTLENNRQSGRGGCGCGCD